MRIVLDATPLLARRTGIGRYTEHLLRALPGALAGVGVDATLAAATWTARRASLPDLPPGVVATGRRFPPSVLHRLWVHVDHPRAEAFVGRADLVHGTNFVVPPARAARRVVTIHDLWYIDGAAAGGSRRYDTLTRRAIAQGAHVVTPSDAVADAVRERYGAPPERVRTTPLGVDDPWFDAAPDGPGRLAGLPGEYLLFVGSREPRKNLDRLVAAHRAARSDDADLPPLVLAGPAGSGQVATLGVVTAGWLSDDALRATVAGARAVLLPSLDEGFGLPALEALAAGRPVLVGDVPALREVTGDLAVRVDPTDVEAITHGIGLVAAAPDGAHDRARRRTWARGWTWERCARETVAAYAGALA